MTFTTTQKRIIAKLSVQDVKVTAANRIAMRSLFEMGIVRIHEDSKGNKTAIDNRADIDPGVAEYFGFDPSNL